VKRLPSTKKILPDKIVPPSNRGIIITIIGAICEKGVIGLNLKREKEMMVEQLKYRR
jgi:hypothetical protein